MVLVSCDCDSWIVKWFYSYMLLNGCCCHLVKILWVILFGEIYCGGDFNWWCWALRNLELTCWMNIFMVKRNWKCLLLWIVFAYVEYIRRGVVILMIRLYNNWLWEDVWLKKFRFRLKLFKVNSWNLNCIMMT